MKTKPAKKDKAKIIHEIEVENIFFLYAVGLEFIAISTKPNDQWGELPDWCKVCFTMSAPFERIESFIHQAIKDKIHEQKRNHDAARSRNRPLGMYSDKSDKAKKQNTLPNLSRKRRRKATSPTLPFECNTSTDN